jgi:hypothetical protein
MSKKKNDEEKEVKTEAQNQEESKTDAEDNKVEAKEKENPLEKELKDTKDQLLRVTAEYSNFRKRSEKEKMKASLLQQSKQFRKSLQRLIISKERLQMSKRITRDLKKVFK